MEDSRHDCVAKRPTPASPISWYARADYHWLIDLKALAVL
jgi:hypothetical protein